MSLFYDGQSVKLTLFLAQTLSHEPKVLQEGLCQLDSILSALEPLHRPIEEPGGSVLLRELANAGHVTDATLSARATPLLHALTAAHAYILMFVHTCRVGQVKFAAWFKKTKKQHCLAERIHYVFIASLVTLSLSSHQSEIRAISVNQWGSQLGLSVLNKLSQLYCSLVWESTVLLSLCTPNRSAPHSTRLTHGRPSAISPLVAGSLNVVV